MVIRQSTIQELVQFDFEHHRWVLGNEPMVFHCHHYNMYLQQTLLEAEYLQCEPLLVGAAVEVAYKQLTNLFAQHRIEDVSERKALAESIYRWAGFGTIDLEPLYENGGTVTTQNSHYVLGWNARNNSPATRPICFFTAGWLAGALAAIYDLPSHSFRATEKKCAAIFTDDYCEFELTREKADYVLFQSPGMGVLSSHKSRSVPESPVDYDGILQAVTQLPLVGNEQGVIPAFGVYLTRHYANYYNLVGFEFFHRINDTYGAEGREIADSLLTEAGRVCAFNTFGGIMQSTEWDALIRPSLQKKEDWVHGIVAVINGLGWGRWQVTKVSEEEAEFVIHDDYESSAHLAAYGKSDYPISFLAKGAAAGIMNLVYTAQIDQRPEMTPELYQKTFKQDRYYEAEPVASQAMGDEATVFRVRRRQ